jgi:hypothetical protein
MALYLVKHRDKFDFTFWLEAGRMMTRAGDFTPVLLLANLTKSQIKPTN